ncbi:ATP-binding cassette domain-containing protein [[Mycoplasma] falconis]|uniref:ATP-binding cassette domain-containing protein n=1 Tax=[Mycoplasma] falconis TaxID=92403 RepID=A0A501XAH6_9BACT|nr:ATP-binding cassette domain-containing protein [[Mycoplasma] falconis]TPE57585.1 ATP-binding cassette domain-containing protein [[Mycoplasma] falconis]
MNKKDDRKVILTIDNLKKYFVNGGYINKAVDGVSFQVHEGEIVGLIGESGSGKTTVGRTLLRLYEDFNGFVKLEDNIISGKKISSKLNHYLRRNVQMIFQDPHASLNGQQNIFTILKEPLLVNGIMKEKIKDIASDWLEVKKNFKYTFNIRAMQLELQNLKEINNLAAPHFNKWKDKFDNFAFDPDADFNDNFNAFFSYLDEKQQMESKIINNMYSNTNELINFYFEQQTKLRNKDLSSIEMKLIDETKNLEKWKLLSKYSMEGYQALLRLKEVKKELAAYKEALRVAKNATLNTFNNFVNENKNEKLMSNITRLGSGDIEFYLYNYKNERIYRHKQNLIKKMKADCRHIQYEEVRNLINELDAYVQKFYKAHLEKLELVYSDKKVIANTRLLINSIIEKEFKFDYSKYVELSKKHQTEVETKLNNYKKQINDLNEIIRQNPTPYINKEQLQVHYHDLEEAKKVYEEERHNYLVKLKSKIKKLYDEIQEQKAIYHSLVDMQTYCNQKFDEAKDAYFEFIASSGESDKISKGSMQAIKSYKSDIAIKVDTLKSFDIEKKYLEKDINDIYVLLGVDIKWVELNLSEEKSHKKKWKNVKRFYDSKIAVPFAMHRISNLLYKTTIYKALEDVGLLKQFAYRYPHEFSGGQLQRIVIARALITNPKIIVADEPIASLDISIQAQVVNLLKELCIKNNIGLIFIAHDLSMIEYVADNVQIMHLGKIVEHGKTEKIYDHPYHPYTINLFKAIPKISNANEKFQNVSFELDYLMEQQFPNIPEDFEVSEDHYVYGTKKQVTAWTKENK